MKQIISTIFMVFLFLQINIHASDTNQTNLTLKQNMKSDNVSKNSVLVLNYLHASLNKIVMYNDKRILEDEYSNIINNINLTVIEDKEIIGIITDLMDTLSAFRLKEIDKEKIQAEYEAKLEKALSSALSQSGKMIGVKIKNGEILDPMSAAVAIVNSSKNAYKIYSSSKKTAEIKLEDSKWKLKKDAISALNKIRKKFLITYWQIMKRYDIPDEKRITEKQFKRFVNVLKEKDNNKKYRQLLRMKKEMSQSLTFWFELSLAAHNAADKNEELSALQKYENLNYRLLRQNSQYSLMLANSLVYKDPKIQKEDIINILNSIQKVDSRNPARKLVMALQYAQINEPKKAINLLDENIDDNFLTEMSKKIKLNLYLKSKDVDNYAKLMDELLNEQRLSVLEYLSYFGKYPLENIEQEIRKQIDIININLDTNVYGKDDLVVSLSKNWVLKDVEDAKLFLVIDGNENKYDKVEFIDNSITYLYSKVIKKSLLLDGKLKNLSIKLVYKKIPTIINYEIKIDNENKDNNTNEKNTSENIKDKTTESNRSSFLNTFYEKSKNVIEDGKNIYKKSEKVYNTYVLEITFIPKSVLFGDKCFDIQNNMKECKK